jgi:aldose 1-epimerase
MREVEKPIFRRFPRNRRHTGKLSAVAGTALDFTSPKTLGRDIGLLLYGYDHCFLVRTGSDGENPVDGSTGLRKLAIMYAPLIGRALSIMITLPAVQLYTGNHLDGTEQGRSAVPYGMHAGVCFETGFPPDAMNHFGFPVCILNPGVLCRNETEYRFSVN